MAKNSRSGHYFPEGVITQILSWTKITSLLRCKSVCKSWKPIISDPNFTQTHHSNSLKHPSLLLITSKTESDQDKPYDHVAATFVYSDCSKVSVPLPWFFDAKRFVGSCNGLVCVTDGIGENVYLYNPLTRMYKQLPHFVNGNDGNNGNNRREEKPYKVDLVFGFDCVSGDFTILRIKYKKELGNNQNVRVWGVEVYSSNGDSWRVIGVGCMELRGFVLYPYCPVLISGPVLDGVLYLEGGDEIVTFDLRSQVFGVIEFPEFMKGRKSNVLDFDGSVALVVESVGHGFVDKEISLWTMERVSDEVFWNKMFVFDSGFEVDWVFLYLGAKHFFVTTKLGKMLYDYGKKETKCIGLPAQSFLTKALKHAESFISIDGFEQVEENWM